MRRAAAKVVRPLRVSAWAQRRGSWGVVEVAEEDTDPLRAGGWVQDDAGVGDDHLLDELERQPGLAAD